MFAPLDGAIMQAQNGGTLLADNHGARQPWQPTALRCAPEGGRFIPFINLEAPLLLGSGLDAAARARQAALPSLAGRAAADAAAGGVPAGGEQQQQQFSKPASCAAPGAVASTDLKALRPPNLAAKICSTTRSIPSDHQATQPPT